MSDKSNNLFEARAKWEQNKLSHSPGKVSASGDGVQFVPGRMSLLGKHVTIPWKNIVTVKKGDNFAFRGVIKIALREPINDRSQYVFFLGTKRKEFLSLCEKMDVKVS